MQAFPPIAHCALMPTGVVRACELPPRCTFETTTARRETTLALASTSTRETGHDQNRQRAALVRCPTQDEALAFYTHKIAIEVPALANLIVIGRRDHFAAKGRQPRHQRLANTNGRRRLITFARQGLAPSAIAPSTSRRCDRSSASPAVRAG